MIFHKAGPDKLLKQIITEKTHSENLKEESNPKEHFSPILTLVPGCDLEHSQGTRVLHRTKVVILFYFSV